MKIKSISVRELYSQSKQADTKLLSDFNADFWLPYKTDYKKYDRFFAHLYASFKYLSDDATLADFTESIESFLAANQKKYAELFRLESISDDVYNILQNYDVTEKMERLRENNRTEMEGERSDTTTMNIGNQSSDVMVSNPDVTTTQENTVSAFDSDIYLPHDKTVQKIDSHAIDTATTIDAHTDSTDYKKGEQNNKSTDNENENYTLSRKGNIGVQTQSDMLMKHLELWNGYEFYMQIFRDIANILLEVDYDDCWDDYYSVPCLAD